MSNGVEAKAETKVQATIEDREVICEWMAVQDTSHQWFVLGRQEGDKVIEDGVRRDIFTAVQETVHLGLIHEVEARLTEEQVCLYEITLQAAIKKEGHPSPLAASMFVWHATAEQKIAALAEVIRSGK